MNDEMPFSLIFRWGFFYLASGVMVLQRSNTVFIVAKCEENGGGCGFKILK